MASSPELVLAAVILVSLVLYSLLGGADFGGGIWDLLAGGPRAEKQRRLIADAIAPVWEANHVWLVLALVLMFTAFPSAFSALMIALNVPLTVVLVGIVLRGSAFAFRRYGSPRLPLHRHWGTVFGAASFMTPLFMGLCVGAAAGGAIRVGEKGPVSGALAGWTSPLAVACGLFVLALLAFLAAVYLTIEAEKDPELQEDFRRKALLAGFSVIPAAAWLLLLAPDGAPHVYRHLTARPALPLLALVFLGGAGSLAALFARRYALARLCAAAVTALSLTAWGLAQFPYIIVPDVTLEGSAAPEVLLRLLVPILLAGAVIVGPSLLYLLYIFKYRGGESPASPENTTGRP